MARLAGSVVFGAIWTAFGVEAATVCFLVGLGPGMVLLVAGLRMAGAGARAGTA